ncbi:MAG: AraC family transcriptional regulator [Clostridia bacterium]|nr:AraC family transcriptional regulator [Clostridia bacterium]
MAGIRYENRAADYYCRTDKDGKIRLNCSPHLHYHIEFVCMIEGNTEAFADADEYTVHAGDLFISFPNQVHRFVSSGPEKYRIFIVSPELTPEFHRIFTSGVPRSAVIRGAAADPEINAITAALTDYSGNLKPVNDTLSDPYRNAVIRGYLLALFGRLLPMIDISTPKTEDSRALREVVGYCSEHYAEDLSLDMLENELHLSKYYISHLFSEKLGIRFNDYVNSLRVSHACRLLRREDMQITEVAASVGFNTLRTFNRAFARFRGMSPSEFRRSGARRTDGASMLPVY